MQRKTLTILLIEDSPDYAELIQKWLSPGGETTFALNWTDSLAIGLNRLSQGGVDLVLLDLGLPDSEGLETFTRTRADGHNVPVIILSGGDSEPLALQMIQDGADDYLIKSTCTRDLLVKAVRYALVRHKQTARSVTEAKSGEPKIIGVIGAKGGVGTTTVACNLAAELHRQTGKKVLLADLDTQAGSVSFLMSVHGKYSILDAISIVRDLDRASWEQLVAKADDALHVLPSPDLMGKGELQVGDIRQVLTKVRTMYDWIVLDLGRLNGISAGVLDIVNQVLLVTTTSIPALYEAKRVIGAVAKAGVEKDCLRVIVNEIDESHQMSRTNLNQIFGAQVFARLPSASEVLHDSCVLRRLPGKNSIIGRELAGLARNVAGLPENQSRRAFQPLFSFADRFLRTNKLSQSDPLKELCGPSA